MVQGSRLMVQGQLMVQGSGSIYDSRLMVNS